ncbi:MAG: hypothetical protein IAG13_08975 [Deltaproteobacteria bacterium]|nr:hypothetical protein [Nannocystaceae bacterium]
MKPTFCALWISLLWLFVPTRVLAAPEGDPTAIADPAPAPAPGAPSREAACADGKDEDGDTVVDCGDADCQSDPACAAGNGSEDTEGACHDWADNDDDGYLDCDDFDCGDTQACMGSWDLEQKGVKVGGGAAGSSNGNRPELAAGQTEDDLIGKGGDNDGERDNVVCADGFDNDNDGRTDCDDLGCRLSSEVTVCQPGTNFRLSVVARVAQSFDVQEKKSNTEFDVLQLRVLGEMPFIQNSFFLISTRLEKTPRVVFAMFQVPLGKKGHYFNVNSGGGTLSLELIRSVHKRMLADPAFYVYNAFEQGNGAAIEFGGPIDRRGKFLYRAFAGGGSGRFAGNIGGRFFPDQNNNYTFSAGAQFWMNLVGYYNRWDTPFVYTPSPLAVALAIGGKYDQRSQERYPASNVQLVVRWGRLQFSAENYAKRELVFKNWQTSYNVQLGVLAVTKRLFFAGDFGQYIATDFEEQPAMLGSDLERQIRELQYRAAAHVYLWRDVLYLTAIWRDRRVERPATEDRGKGIDVIQDARLLLTYRW